MKNYLYAPSYLSIRYFLFLKKNFSNLVIITSNNDLAKFSKKMNWELIYFDSEFELIPNKYLPFFLKNVILFIKKKQLINKKICQIVSKMNAGKLYFSTNVIDLWILKLVKSIKNYNSFETIYLDDVQVTSTYKIVERLNINERKFLYYNSFLYSLPLKYFLCTGNKYLGISMLTLKKYKVQHHVNSDIFYSNVCYPEIITTQNYPILIIGGNRIDESEKFFKTESLYKVLKYIKKIRPDSFYKYHPGEIVHNDFLDSFPQVEKFIPTEFLSKNLRIVIGDYTSSFKGLCEKNNIICISYLNLLEITENFNKTFWVNKLNNDTNGKLIFVNSFKELGKIISNKN